MGMAATQARFLSLTARRSNIEFQGQQINQQRTTLSNQSASYYSQLCNMVVPTPPSVDDYTKVTYTFNDGAMTNAITTMLTNPNKAIDGAPYLISYIQQWQDDYTPVEAATSFVSRIQESSGEYGYYIGSNKLVKLAEINPDNNEAFFKAGKVAYTVKKDDDGNLYIDRPSNADSITKCSDEDINNLRFALYDESNETISSITKSDYENYMNGSATLNSGVTAVAYLFNDDETDSQFATQWVTFDGSDYFKEVSFLSEDDKKNIY